MFISETVLLLFMIPCIKYLLDSISRDDHTLDSSPAFSYAVMGHIDD